MQLFPRPSDPVLQDRKGDLPNMDIAGEFGPVGEIDRLFEPRSTTAFAEKLRFHFSLSHIFTSTKLISLKRTNQELSGATKILSLVHRIAELSL